MDCRGHGESVPPPGCRQWDIGTYSFIDVNRVVDYVLFVDDLRGGDDLLVVDGVQH